MSSTTAVYDIGKSPANTKSVYQLIAQVAAELARSGIAKDERNPQGAGYNFRGIDSIYNVAGPILAKNGLVILPRCVSRECVERVSAAGKPLFWVTVKVEYDFVASQDGSTHTVTMYGEAMDSGDKATNKAMSAALKYAVLQTFCIPTKGDDNDADASTHEVAVEKLSEEQIAELTTLAIEVGADIAAIKKFYKVAEITDVPATAYPGIMRSLEKKRPVTGVKS